MSRTDAWLRTRTPRTLILAQNLKVLRPPNVFFLGHPVDMVHLVNFVRPPRTNKKIRIFCLLNFRFKIHIPFFNWSCAYVESSVKDFMCVYVHLIPEENTLHLKLINSSPVIISFELCNSICEMCVRMLILWIWAPFFCSHHSWRLITATNYGRTYYQMDPYQDWMTLYDFRY